MPTVPTVPEEATFTSAPEGPATSYSETRFFPHGAAWLGYLEGRPGVLGVSAAFPSRGGEPVRELSRAAKAERKEAREVAAERLAESEPGQNAKDEGGAAFTSWLEDMLTIWDFAEDGGVLAEVECDGDSGKSE